MIPVQPLTGLQLEAHLRAARHLAECGLARHGFTADARARDEMGNAGNAWQLFLTVGPNVDRKTNGSMELWAELYEQLVEPHEYLDHDQVETVTRGRLRTTGEFPENIATLAGWLLAHGWRGELNGRLVSHPAAQVEFIVVDGEVHALQRVRHGEGAAPIES